MHSLSLFIGLVLGTVPAIVSNFIYVSSFPFAILPHRVLYGFWGTGKWNFGVSLGWTEGGGEEEKDMQIAYMGVLSHNDALCICQFLLDDW